MNGNGRKPLLCPCCLAGGVKKQNPLDHQIGDRLKQLTVWRRGQAVRRFAVQVTCRRCEWTWWSASPVALERAVKLERGRLAGMGRTGRGLTPRP